MAERTRRRAAAAPNGGTPEQQQEDDKPTKRVVLKRERVLVVAEGVDDAHLKEAQKVLRQGDKTDNNGVYSEAWTVVGEFEGKSKNAAIEAHAGKPNTPEAKPGAYKAPTASAFAGGRLYERPPEPKVEAKDLD